MEDEYVSYKSPSTIGAETVYLFLRGGICGAAFGLVTPFHAPGSRGALEEMKTGVVKAARPFSSLVSVHSNAIIFGSLFGVQRFGCKSLELVRARQDAWNDLFGCALAYQYYSYFISSSEARLIAHNRVVTTSVVLLVAYANLSPNAQK